MIENQNVAQKGSIYKLFIVKNIIQMLEFMQNYLSFEHHHRLLRSLSHVCLTVRFKQQMKKTMIIGYILFVRYSGRNRKREREKFVVSHVTRCRIC